MRDVAHHEFEQASDGKSHTFGETPVARTLNSATLLMASRPVKPVGNSASNAVPVIVMRVVSSVGVGRGMSG